MPFSTEDAQPSGRCRAETSGGSSSDSGSSSVSYEKNAAQLEAEGIAESEVAAARAQEDAARAQRSAIEAAEEAAEKESIRTKASLIENTEFNTDDQTEFLQKFAAMCTEYKNCSDSKKRKLIKDAYKARLEKELKDLSISKPDLAERAKPFYKEVEEFFADRHKKQKHIVSVLVVVGCVVGFFVGIGSGEGLLGIVCGPVLGAAAAIYGRKKAFSLILGLKDEDD